MEEPIRKNNDRFYTEEENKLLNKRIDEIKLFFKKRPIYIEKQIKEHFWQVVWTAETK